MATAPRKPEASTTCWTSASWAEEDPEAFNAIYRTYRGFVHRICVRILRDPIEAEDATQDVFIRLLQKAHTFRGDSAFSSWLYRLTTNVALMRIRKNKGKAGVIAECPLDPAVPNSRHSAKASANELDLVNGIELKGAIHLLPDGCKAVLVLHDLKGYRHHEIADICGCTIGNSKSQLHRARIRLRKLLARH